MRVRVRVGLGLGFSLGLGDGEALQDGQRHDERGDDVEAGLSLEEG